jgi:hypothetical protein
MEEWWWVKGIYLDKIKRHPDKPYVWGSVLTFSIYLSLNLNSISIDERSFSFDAEPI